MCLFWTESRTTNGKAMNRTLSSSIVTTFLLGSTVGLISCATPPLSSRVDSMDEPRRAARVVQDREQELATLRADMAATRIAGAKKEADLQEMRALVVQLRQENIESRQAVLDANRTTEARHTELTTLKAERDQLAVAQAQQGKSDQQFTALQETVATLSQDLAQLKQAMTISNARAVVQESNANERKGSETKAKRQMTGRRDATPVHQAPTSGHIVPAVHIVRDEIGVPKPSRVTVQPGDSLWGLARRHKTTIEALRAANGLVGDQLVVGQGLTLP